MTTHTPLPEQGGFNEPLAYQLHHYYMWSQDNIADLIDATRPKVKKMISGEVQPNDLQSVLIKEVVDRQMSHKEFIREATRHYRLKLIRWSDDDTK